MSLSWFIKRFAFTPENRRKSRWNRFSKYGKRNGFQVYVPHAIWQTDQKFLAASREWGKRVGLPDDRRFFIFSTAASVRDVPGDTADVGVRYGTSSFFIQRAIDHPTKSHHMFDSFEGLSEPTAADETGVKTKWKKGALKSDEEVARENMASFPNCKIYRGWIPDRFAEVQDKAFCLLHIDVDLYQPTLETLQFFYSRMSPGGVIICDDYGLSSCVGAKKAFDEFFADKPESIIHIPTGQSLVMKLSSN